MYLVCAERISYWLVWVAATIYSQYEFAQACQSKSLSYRLDLADFDHGFLNKNYYDASDFEWQSFKKLYINYWYIVFIHFGLSNVFAVYDRPVLKLTSWILVTTYATYTVFSAAALLVVMINIMMLILLAILGKNILSYALCFGVVLASQSTEIANRIFNPNDPRLTHEFDYEEKRFLFTYCICFLNARGLSSSIDNLTARQKREIQSGKDQFYEKVLTVTAYLLYLPGFFAGPIYLYDDFEKATRIVNAEPKRGVFIGSSYFKSMGSLLLLMVQVIYYEWLLHWLYSSAITTDHVLVEGFNCWQLSGFIVSLCILFYMKYSCIFGTFKMLATFDGIGSVAPPLPQCPAAMHLNSQLWRNFDVGIYVWLRKYVYDPITSTGTKNSLVSKLIGTLLCFFCIALWHLPLTPTLNMWIGLNVISALVEIWAKTVSKTDLYLIFKSKISRSWYMRLLAVISLPLFITAIVSSIFFLSENELVGHEFLNRVLHNHNNYALYLMLVLYCGANVSIDYNRVVKESDDMIPNCKFVYDFRTARIQQQQQQQQQPLSQTSQKAAAAASKKSKLN